MRPLVKISPTRRAVCRRSAIARFVHFSLEPEHHLHIAEFAENSIRKRFSVIGTELFFAREAATPNVRTSCAG